MKEFPPKPAWLQSAVRDSIPSIHEALNERPEPLQELAAVVVLKDDGRHFALVRPRADIRLAIEACYVPCPRELYWWFDNPISPQSLLVFVSDMENGRWGAGPVGPFSCFQLSTRHVGLA